MDKKYRPKTFNQVIGHSYEIESIKNLIKSGNFPHAILLSGDNGLGKTTIARIIANELKCEVIEIDGSTFGRIEIMRDIAENLKYPAIGEFTNKMVIIDEAHGLSKQSWDSWLKQIEEPPKHLYFIFCTTEEDKVIKGIKQRCHHYKLKPVNTDEIEAFIEFVANEENIILPKYASNLIAKESYGSPRQALIYLSQVRNAKTLEEITNIIRSGIDKPEVYNLCRFIVKNSFKSGYLLEVIKLLMQLKDVNPYSIRLQVLNFIIGCINNSKTDKELLYFLSILEIFESAKPEFPSLMLAVGELFNKNISR